MYRIMARFACLRCGKCCQNFGPYLTVERELEEGHYYCHCSLSGEHFFARIIGKEMPAFVEKTFPGQAPCPFLCREGSSLYTCAIYPTRPRFCREYQCSSMDILDGTGERRGRVGGRRSLISKDQDLVTLWQKEIQPLPEDSEIIWRETVKAILEKGGYRVIVYERGNKERDPKRNGEMQTR
ncbi:MAG: YkgJ family cysteine cluster protein [Methanomicrobiales archaeon]|nr:YkgJ family cysteine cluster protein [Methanomicrobiales archaeon]